MELKKKVNEGKKASGDNRKKTTLPSGVFVTKAQKLNMQVLKLVANR